MQKCRRALAPRGEKLNFLRLSELRVVAFAQFAKKSEKTCDFVNIEYQKLNFRSLTRWLLLYRSLPRMLQL